MNEKGLTIEELLNVINQLPKDMECLKPMGKLCTDKKESYQKAYEHFIHTNNNTCLNGENLNDDNVIKGQALESLVSLLFESTGGFFEVYRNIRNGSNEVDLFVGFSKKGKTFSSILDNKFSNIVCECKNYGKNVDVTYVGKFYSLLNSTNNKLGIMFSYGGMTGKSWGAAKGLTKKLFLLREKEDDKIYILDFDNTDFKKILDGESLFDILENKCKSLKMGVDDITKYIVKHPNEDEAVEPKNRQV